MNARTVRRGLLTFPRGMSETERATFKAQLETAWVAITRDGARVTSMILPKGMTFTPIPQTLVELFQFEGVGL